MTTQTIQSSRDKSHKGIGIITFSDIDSNGFMKETTTYEDGSYMIKHIDLDRAYPVVKICAWYDKNHRPHRSNDYAILLSENGIDIKHFYESGQYLKSR